jgi:hypothetical protein
MFKKSLIALIATALSIPAVAQNPAVANGLANAWAFAYGVNPLVASLQVDQAGGPTTAAGVATLSVAFGTVALGDGTIITPLAVGFPVTVGTGANSETVTPTAVSCGTPQVYQSCTFTATFTNLHGTGDRVSSASFGINEAANYMLSTHGNGLVAATPELFDRAGVTTLAGSNTFLLTIKSVGPSVTLLNYIGFHGATSYNGAAGIAYASNTTTVLY